MNTKSTTDLPTGAVVERDGKEGEIVKTIREGAWVSWRDQHGRHESFHLWPEVRLWSLRGFWSQGFWIPAD